MFLPGMLVYLAELQFGSGERPWRINRLASNRPAVLLVAAGVIFIVARVVWMAPASDIALRALVLWAISCGLALLALVRHPPSGRITRTLAAVGTVSYGLYLWHGVIVTAAAHHPQFVPLRHSGPLAYVVHLAFLLSTSMVMAILSWRLIEEPLIARSRKWRPRSTPVTPPVEAPLLETADGVPGA
jgi:peptidoglycan/LPS O-acetylase OafA/YrhL